MNSELKFRFSTTDEHIHVEISTVHKVKGTHMKKIEELRHYSPS